MNWKIYLGIGIFLVLFLGGIWVFWQKSEISIVPWELLTPEEMAPWEGNLEKITSPPSTLVLEKFFSQWEKISPQVEKKITSERLLSISRWAKEQMKGYVLPKRWIQNIPMNPAQKRKESEKYILFSQEVEQGFPVPSHSPIVFRRVVVAALYDQEQQAIIRVYVSIRGWKEE